MGNLIFISYAHKDSDSVLPVIAALLEEGHNVWFDEGIEAGTEWPATIEKKIRDCSLLIAFISNSSVQSQNCRNEINFAVSLGKEILTVYLEDTKLAAGMNLQLGSLQAMFKHRHKSEESFINSLLISDIVKSKKGVASRESEISHFPTHIKDSSEQPNDILGELRGAKIKSTVKFGSYPSFRGEPTPIEWLVLEKQYGTALLLSKYVLGAMDFGEEYCWGKSDIRKWLNTDFYGSAFSSEEKRYILENERFTETLAGEEKTKESVFLLDRREVKHYFGLFDGKYLLGIPTNYASNCGAVIEKKCCLWWLRSSHGVNYASSFGNQRANSYPPSLKGDKRTTLSFIAPIHPYHHLVFGSHAMSILRYYNSDRRLQGTGIRPAIWVRYE